MATFGGGHDFSIVDNCNTSNANYSNFGHSYSTPAGSDYGSEGAKSYLAGAYNFLVSEIEVYQVKQDD